MNYDFSADALFRPQTRAPFVGSHHIPTFNPTAGRFDPEAAWWLAGAAHAAYHPSSLLQAILRPVGLRLEDTFRGGTTFAFIASRPGQVILAFRGTRADALRDVLTDLDITLAPVGAGGRVHRGFLRALEQVWEAVDAGLQFLAQRGDRLWYTGHSLGGALATLAAARRPPEALVTFGSPMVGDARFTQNQRFPAYRVVNCCDVIPALPPSGMGFRHVGEHCFLTSRGRLLVNPQPGELIRSKRRGIVRHAARLPWLRREMVTLRELADHAIVNYAAGLQRAHRSHAGSTPQNALRRDPIAIRRRG